MPYHAGAVRKIGHDLEIGKPGFTFPYLVEAGSEANSRPPVGQRRYRWHCVTSPKVAGSIPDGVLGICEELNPSGRPVALGQLSL